MTAYLLLLHTLEEEAALFLLGTVAVITQFLGDIQLVMGDGSLFEVTHRAEIKSLLNNPTRSFDSIN